MNCYSCRELISPYMDNELYKNEKYHFLSHLDTCPHCDSLFQKEKLIMDKLRNICEQQLTPSLPEDFYKQVLKRVN